MITKTSKATVLGLMAVVTFATVASTPVSAKGRGVYGPVHGVGSSHNPLPGGRSHFPYQGIGRLSGIFNVPPSGIGRFPPPRLPFPPPNGAPKGGPQTGGPTHGWGGGRGYGMGSGFGRGVGVASGSACPVRFHWSPKFLQCIPNYT